MEGLNLGQWIDGKKTYIMVIATVCYALGGAVAGYVPVEQAIMLILGALGLGGLRHGVEKSKTAIIQPQPQQ